MHLSLAVLRPHIPFIQQHPVLKGADVALVSNKSYQFPLKCFNQFPTSSIRVAVGQHIADSRYGRVSEHKISQIGITAEFMNHKHRSYGPLTRLVPIVLEGGAGVDRQQAVTLFTPNGNHAIPYSPAPSTGRSRPRGEALRKRYHHDADYSCGR